MAALHGHSRGSSVVEFAIVMPLFIALVYGAMFLTEVGNYKLKAQEIARFGAFAFSNYELSGFDTPKLEHERSWKAARTGVGTQLTNLYSDLDAARIGYGSNPGGLLMKADYVPEAASNVFAPSLTNRQMEIIPAALNAQFSEPLSAMWWALSLSGIGVDVQDFFRNVVDRGGMNTLGLVRSRPILKLSPLENVQRAFNLAAAGKSRGADLTRWGPVGTVKDSRSRFIEMSVLMDPWRVIDGAAVGPRETAARYANAVTRVRKNAIAMLPGGPLISILISANYVQEKLPRDVMSLFEFQTDRLNQSRVMSMPYSKSREPKANPTGDPEQGQVNIYDYFSIQKPANRVQNFDTLPFLADPDHPTHSDYAEMLNERGPNFMGCPDSEERGCWE